MTIKVVSRVVTPEIDVGAEMTRIIKERAGEYKLIRWEAVPFWTHDSKADHILLVMEFDDGK